MTLPVRAVFWAVAYLGAVLSPLVFAAIGASQPDHSFWTNFSVALGFVGLAMMGLEFVLVARSHRAPLWFVPVAPLGRRADSPHVFTTPQGTRLSKTSHYYWWRAVRLAFTRPRSRLGTVCGQPTGSRSNSGSSGSRPAHVQRGRH